VLCSDAEEREQRLGTPFARKQSESRDEENKRFIIIYIVIAIYIVNICISSEQLLLKDSSYQI